MRGLWGGGVGGNSDTGRDIGEDSNANNKYGNNYSRKEGYEVIYDNNIRNGILPNYTLSLDDPFLWEFYRYWVHSKNGIHTSSGITDNGEF